MASEIEIVVVPEELKESISEKCCIFRVSPLLLQTDPDAFKPQLVSIGPFHNPMFQMHKEWVLDRFLERANGENAPEMSFRSASSELEVVTVADLEVAVGNLDEAIRDSYSVTLPQTREELAKMMVLDGAFLVMMLLSERKKEEFCDTVFSIPDTLPTLQRDMLLLENQVPFIVLETLFAKVPSTKKDFRILACEFFQCMLGRMPDEALANAGTNQPKHLLDLVRKTWIPIPSPGESRRYRGHHTPEFILSAKELQSQGIKLRAKRNAEIILDVEIKGNVVLIPSIILDRFTSTFLLNGVAYEQRCRTCEDFMTSYVVLMGFLMKDKEAASLVCHEKIIQNCLGSDEMVSNFFTEVRTRVAFNLSKSYLAPVFGGINAYTSKLRCGLCTGFKLNYCGSPWIWLSSLVTLVIITLTLIQVVFSILSYKNDTKKAPGPSPL